MKKLCTLLFLLTALFSTGRAGEVNLGYCNGVVNRSGNVGASGRAWVDAAIVLPSSLLQPYTGNNITKVRVGLATALKWTHSRYGCARRSTERTLPRAKY